MLCFLQALDSCSMLWCFGQASAFPGLTLEACGLQGYGSAHMHISLLSSDNFSLGARPLVRA